MTSHTAEHYLRLEPIQRPQDAQAVNGRICEHYVALFKLAWSGEMSREGGRAEGP